MRRFLSLGFVHQGARCPARGFRPTPCLSGGFTLVELVFVVFLLGVLVTLAYPHVESALDQAGYMDCESHLEMIRRAKTAYVIDHMGAGSPGSAEDQAVFRQYFRAAFPFTCPRSSDVSYQNVYNIYRIAQCPYCQTNRPDGVAPRDLQP